MSDKKLDRAMLQASMDASPFIKNAQMSVTSVDHERDSITVTMPLLPEFERAPETGQFHGGPIASLIDTAGCYALVMILKSGVPTVNFRVDYLRPAFNTSLRAVANVRRVGKTVGVVDVDVFDDSERLVAVGRGTFSNQTG